MKFIFLMFSLLQVMFSSLHKSHQNQSVQFLRYENPSDSLNIQSENQIQSVPRFISNTQTIAAMKKRRNASINNPNKLKLPNKNSIYDPSKLRINENSLENINDNDNYNLISSKKNSVESRENIEIISNKKNKESQEGNPCKCDNSIICPSCIKSLNFKNSNCYCAQPPELKCPSCNVGKAVRQIHEEAQKEAKMIEINNEALIKEVDMQSMLFQKVKKYAQEIGELEKQARTAAVQLQIYSNKAMALKAKMFKTQNQAKALAVRTIQNAEINSLDQDKNKFPSIVIKTKGKNNNNNKKYDISINNNEFNVLDDLDIDLAENTKTDSERNE